MQAWTEAEKSMSRPEEMMKIWMKMKMEKEMKIEKHEQTQLLPHPQPGVQPEGKTGVLGAPGMVENILHMITIDLHQPYNYLVPLVGGKYFHI